MSIFASLAEHEESSTADRSFDLVEMLLTEQQSMTAVERFSQFQDAQEDSSAEPDQSRYYRELLPATPPLPGQQLSFHVDLDSCSGCKACVVACHTMNGLEEDESWRRVGTITVGKESESRIQHVTSACHHCEDPGCLNGCPVKAYDKDPATGIVRHLDDQCIGCKYCTMMCPYEVPRYSKRLGIVRKCDMCHQRLSVGEAPACVQSCPNQAIAIRAVTMPEKAFRASDRLSPGAPLSTITRPSTHYRSEHQRLLHAAKPQDVGIDQVAESHWPLAVMLVATQCSVGMLIAERLAAASMSLLGSSMPVEATRVNALLAMVVAMIGMMIAPKHLGQPLRAWRVFLGLRTSWLSREAVVLGKYVGALGVALALLWMPLLQDYLPTALTSRVPTWLAGVVLAVACLLGAAGLHCSGMIYVATRRALWRHQRTLLRFFGTAVITGAAFSAVALTVGSSPQVAGVFALIAALWLSVKLRWEWGIHLGPDRQDQDLEDERSRRLVHRRLGMNRRARLFTAIVGVCLLVVGGALALDGVTQIALITLTGAAALVMIGEGLERLLYFSSVVYDRMPGTLSSGIES